MLEGQPLPFYKDVPVIVPSKRSRAIQMGTQAMLPSNQASTSSTSVARKVKARRTQAVSERRCGAEIGHDLPTGPSELEKPHFCPHCNAKKFAFEGLHFCCCNGQVKLAENEFPPELKRLWTSNDEDAVHFRQYARIYNNMFAFSSLGGTIDAETKKGIYVFKLYGQIYHHLPDLLPAERSPRFLQMYFYDGQHEANNRGTCLQHLRQDVINILMEVTKINPYARFFRSLREVNVTEQTQIRINKNPITDQRTSNVPTSDEVAVIWPDSCSSSETNSPHITVSGKSDKSHRILHYYGCYDPLQYPLLHVFGESGWTQGLKKSPMGTDTLLRRNASPSVVHENSTEETLLATEASRLEPGNPETKGQVSCREYYCYKLQTRTGNLMLKAGRCLQQYMVDMYVKVENTRLDFFRNNQKTVRAELYQGVLDSVHQGECAAANVGRRVILPPTFIGGPRDMKRRYLNAMALVQRYGKPDFFITMTCNTNWPEIKAELDPGEKAQNRPDLVSRIFHAKLTALKKQIMEKKIFGDVAALIYAVEFQKRGLPHAHLLIILKPDYKIKCSADFDKFVSAEIPPSTNSYLRKIVLKHMMHGPCGTLDPECACMKHSKSLGTCKYAYPKQFSDYTTNNKDGYPMYRRRDTVHSGMIRRGNSDNRWVIPYNPYLLSLFSCHLNVEVCSTIQAVKYLYKYIYKGHDKVSFNVGPANEVVVDEIRDFQAGRWVSPCEAAWRLFGFNIFETHPSVMPLQVHLENLQSVQIRPNEHLLDVISDPKRHQTPLTEFFQVNATAGRTGLLYGEFCEHYRWETSKKKWLKRKNKQVAIGRLTFVSPSEGDRYFLRLLLLNVRGPKSYADLLTVDGYRHSTFQEAALSLGLLEVDNAPDKCLEEACQAQMPVALRRLFAIILIFCQPSNPKNLWSKYYQCLSADFAHQFQGNVHKIQRLTVESLERYLEAMGKSLKLFGLEELHACQDDNIRRTRDIVDALDAPIPETCMVARTLLNTDQQIAFDAIMMHVREDHPGAFFIDGPGGTGKTFLYNALYAEVRLMGKIVLPTASSGIAANNIPSGRTAHSSFEIPLDTDACLSCDVPKQSSLAALIKETSLIIWDEASMARRENVESLDLLLRDLCKSDELFGGKLVVFGGDFRQVLPVVPRKSVQEAVAASLVNSKLWHQFKRFSLKENIRARDDLPFSNFLLALGNGELQSNESALVEMPAKLVKSYLSTENPINTIANTVFPDIESRAENSEMFITRAVLTPINNDVDLINTEMIRRFPGEQVLYKSFDSLLDDNCNLYPTEFINKLCPGGMSPHEVVLKGNCPVILLRNIMPAFGLCNGTRMICKRFYPNLIECMITTGQHHGEHVFIPRIKLRPSSSTNYPFQFQRVQFPLKLSFAMTINKAQGQTLNQVVVYLPQPCFSPGQLYVALSRARKSEQVCIMHPSPGGPTNLCLVKNIVSYDVLRLAGIIE